MSILQSVDARITCWYHKLLSQYAKTSLVKHVGQAIPIYQMKALLIPNALCRKMDSYLCKYWWGEILDPEERKFHLLGWDTL